MQGIPAIPFGHPSRLFQKPWLGSDGDCLEEPHRDMWPSEKKNQAGGLGPRQIRTQGLHCLLRLVPSVPEPEKKATDSVELSGLSEN